MGQTTGVFYYKENICNNNRFVHFEQIRIFLFGLFRELLFFYYAVGIKRL